MSRVIAVAIAVMVILAARPAVAQDGAAPLGVRFSTAPDKVRVVLDLPAETTFTDKSTPAAPAVLLAVPLKAALPAVVINDPIVTGVTIAPDAAGQALVTVTLAKARKSTVFTLPAADGRPFRVVIDVLKRYRNEERKNLSPAISYLRREEQTDERYLATHVLEIDARDPQVRLALVAAQGDRERVAAMVTRTGAVAGINGGYFLNGTRAVGLLKVDGQVRSLPIWGRTAVAIPATGAPVFGNPTGVWRVTLPDGTTRDLPDSLDASIATPAPPATVTAGINFAKAPACPTALTVIVRNGVVAPRTDMAPLGAADFALQFTGADATALDPVLVEGAAVTVTPVLTPAWTEYSGAVGAGPRLLQDGAVKVTGEVERFQPDILRGRNARTGLGVTKDGRVIFAVAEAPGPYGGGVTLTELANLLKAHGAVDAMNLDGGGSTNLAIGPATVNYPPTAWIRPVADGLLVYDTRVKPAENVQAKMK